MEEQGRGGCIGGRIVSGVVVCVEEAEHQGGGVSGRRGFGVGGEGGSTSGRGASGQLLNAEQYEGGGSVMKMRGSKYSEYSLVLGSNSNSKFLTLETSPCGASQYQFQVLRNISLLQIDISLSPLSLP